MLAGTRLYFSGAESRRILETFDSFQVPLIQVSYFYLRKVFGDPAEAEPVLARFPEVLIDSGLIYHKYKSEAEKKQFIEDFGLYISKLDPKCYTSVVTHLDLDLEKILDESKLLYPLEDLEELLEGDQKAIFSNCEYIGLSNKIVQQDDRMNQICSLAMKNGVKLHAFGTSSRKILQKFPIYSANTSSWRSGSRYANTYIYEGPGRGLHLYQPSNKSDFAKTDREKKNIRTRQRNFVESKQQELFEQIDWASLIEGDDSWEVDKANLTQWMLYQKDLILDTKRAYWLTEDDKRRLQEERTLTVSGSTTRDDVLPAVREDTTQEIIESKPIKRKREVDPRLIQPRMCDTCILANRCPKFQAGSTCYFGLTESYDVPFLDEHIDEDVADLLAMQHDRIMQGYLEEKSDGAGLSKDLSREIRLYLEMIDLFNNSKADTFSASIKAKGQGTGLLDMFRNK